MDITVSLNNTFSNTGILIFCAFSKVIQLCLSQFAHCTLKCVRYYFPVVTPMKYQSLLR